MPTSRCSATVASACSAARRWIWAIWVDALERRDLVRRLEQDRIVQDFDASIRRADGEIRIARMSGGMLELNGKRCVIMVVRDVTRQKEQEEALRLAARVFESTAEGILITDPRSRIVAVNQAFTELTGYTEEEVRGRQPSLLASGRHDRRFFDEMWDGINRNGRWHGEVWNRTQAGEVRPYLITISALARRPRHGAQLRGRAARHLHHQAVAAAARVPGQLRWPHRPGQPQLVLHAPEGGDREGRAAPPPARRGVHRPGQLQGHQRHARSRRGRRAAVRDRQAHQDLRAPGGRGVPAGRRRVHRVHRGLRRRAGAGGHRAAPDPGDRRALSHHRARHLRHRQRGHQRLSQRRQDHVGAAEERRHGDVQGQGAGQERLPVLPRGHERARLRAPGVRVGPAPRAGARRVPAGLPAAGAARRPAGAGRRVPAALEPSGHGRGLTRLVHSGGRGDRADRADRRVGVPRGMQAAARVGRVVGARVGERVGASVPPAGAGGRDRAQPEGDGAATRGAAGGDHRERAHRRSGERGRHARPAEGHGADHLARRLRHRLLFAVVPEALPDRLPEDRPRVRPRHRRPIRTTPRSSPPSSRWPRV